MTWDEVLAYCLAKPGAWQDEPWDGDVVAKVGPKVFVFLGSGSSPAVGVKCGPSREVADEWLLRYPDEASVMAYIGRSGWNTLQVGGAIPDDEIIEAIDASYTAVVSKLPKKDRPLPYRDGRSLSDSAMRDNLAVVDGIEVTAADGLAAASVDDPGMGAEQTADRRLQVADRETAGEKLRAKRRTGREGERVVSGIGEDAAVQVAVLLAEVIADVDLQRRLAVAVSGDPGADEHAERLGRQHQPGCLQGDVAAHSHAWNRIIATVTL
jgi:predicted DNA-binding protein (MmcQ/YjbR family)